MQVVFVTASSSDYAVKCLIEMLRLSNKYKKGVARRTYGEPKEGSWDIVVVEKYDGPVENTFAQDHFLVDANEPTHKATFLKVEEFAKKYGLI